MWICVNSYVNLNGFIVVYLLDDHDNDQTNITAHDEL
jgi:hypothetical protein